MTITLQAVNELIQSLESAGELSIKERKYLDLAKAYADKESESVAQALTFEKCRELSGCPAGVDLQEWVKQLAAENVALKEYRPEPYGIAIMDALDAFFADEEVPERAMMAAFEILCAKRMPVPATDRIVAGIKADGRIEGAHFVANRILAAWDAGFIEDSATNAADIARMILTSTEFMADAPEGDFDRSFADGVLEYIAAQLRKGADK
ncbi:Eae-like protein [Klebsiella aerogenes]|uniref:Eae-like protein n=1 Tax=Klebsiella aerogenes TaxID=548 RepID=UPI0020A6AC29|nr:Eae-like protein [Klebsiella aerogenes]